MVASTSASVSPGMPTMPYSLSACSPPLCAFTTAVMISSCDSFLFTMPRTRSEPLSTATWPRAHPRTRLPSSHHHFSPGGDCVPLWELLLKVGALTVSDLVPRDTSASVSASVTVPVRTDEMPMRTSFISSCIEVDFTPSVAVRLC